MLKWIWNVLSDNWQLIIAGIAIIVVAKMSAAQELQITTPDTVMPTVLTTRLDSCRQSIQEPERTDMISFSGEMLVDGEWSVPYSTITIAFADGKEFVWSPRTVATERKLALMDWIATTLAHQEKTGYPPFATRGDGNLIWLVSPFLMDGKIDCLAHLLDTPVPH